MGLRLVLRHLEEGGRELAARLTSCSSEEGGRGGVWVREPSRKLSDGSQLHLSRLDEEQQLANSRFLGKSPQSVATPRSLRGGTGPDRTGCLGSPQEGSGAASGIPPPPLPLGGGSKQPHKKTQKKNPTLDQKQLSLSPSFSSPSAHSPPPPAGDPLLCSFVIGPPCQ